MKPMMRTAALMMIALLATAATAGAQDEPVVTDTVVMTTTAGTVTLELYGEDAPRSVENFVKLAEKGFYRGILFHRVVPGFVIQAGDPATRDTALRSQWGTGGESAFGGPFEDELNPNAPSFKRGYIEGTMAMANRGPNTNTSQFFIALNNSVKMQKHFTIFGRVRAGMDVVHAIERAEMLDLHAGLPLRPVMITDVKVVHLVK